jgi:Pyruvate/2-oxoglutarate dehydrogenase complex, dehydrogenase (E1) component, eukaryotic type, beta subunit
MREVTFLEAIRLAMWEEMERDPNVFIIGETSGAWAARLASRQAFWSGSVPTV